MPIPGSWRDVWPDPLDLAEQEAEIERMRWEDHCATQDMLVRRAVGGYQQSSDLLGSPSPEVATMNDKKTCATKIAYGGYHYTVCGRTARFVDERGQPACGIHRHDKPATATQVRAAEKRLRVSKTYEARTLAYTIADLVAKGEQPSKKLIDDYIAARKGSATP